MDAEHHCTSQMRLLIDRSNKYATRTNCGPGRWDSPLSFNPLKCTILFFVRLGGNCYCVLPFFWYSILWPCYCFRGEDAKGAGVCTIEGSCSRSWKYFPIGNELFMSLLVLFCFARLQICISLEDPSIVYRQTLSDVLIMWSFQNCS